MKKQYRFNFPDLKEEEIQYPPVMLDCPKCGENILFYPKENDFEEDGSLTITCACGQMIIAEPIKPKTVEKKDRRFDHELPRGIVKAFMNIYALNARMRIHIDKIDAFISKELGDDYFKGHFQDLVYDYEIKEHSREAQIEVIQLMYAELKEMKKQGKRFGTDND